MAWPVTVVAGESEELRRDCQICGRFFFSKRCWLCCCWLFHVRSPLSAVVYDDLTLNHIVEEVTLAKTLGIFQSWGGRAEHFRQRGEIRLMPDC